MRVDLCTDLDCIVEGEMSEKKPMTMDEIIRDVHKAVNDDRAKRGKPEWKFEPRKKAA